MQDLWRLSAADIAALIRSKKISARDAASAALARLDAVKWDMLNEWARTRKAPRHAAWMHEAAVTNTGSAS